MSENRNTADHTSNRCVRCGRTLPEGASFCPYCETQQVQAVDEMAPPRKGRTIAAGLFCIVTAVVIVLIAFVTHRPQTYRGSSKVSYPFAQQSVEVIASFDVMSGEDGHISPEISTKAALGSEQAVPLWLCVYSSSDPSAAEKFAQQIESCTIEAVPADTPQGTSDPSSAPSTEEDASAVLSTETHSAAVSSTPMTILGPEPVTDPSLSALWKADLIYTPENGTNELRWTITMKNKDTIHVSQTFTCTPMPVVDLYYQDVPLETAADIEDAAASVSEDTILNLFLPPVTIAGPLNLSDRCVNLFGSSDGNQTTTFTDQITVSNRKPDMMTLSDITFDGDGKTAILAEESLYLSHCVFTGWDIAIDAVEGSWPIIESCTFDGNHIGLRFNSSSSSASTDGCYACDFRNNDIGAYLIRIPGNMEFGFPECTFEGNGTDVKQD